MPDKAGKSRPRKAPLAVKTYVRWSPALRDEIQAVVAEEDTPGGVNGYLQTLVETDLSLRKAGVARGLLGYARLMQALSAESAAASILQRMGAAPVELPKPEAVSPGEPVFRSVLRPDVDALGRIVVAEGRTHMDLSVGVYFNDLVTEIGRLSRVLVGFPARRSKGSEEEG